MIALTLENVCQWLRAPGLQKGKEMWDLDVFKIHHKTNTEQLPERYSPVAKIEAIIALAKKYFPHSLNQLDHHGALPIHYVCQAGGACAGELARNSQKSAL